MASTLAPPTRTQEVRALRWSLSKKSVALRRSQKRGLGTSGAWTVGQHGLRGGSLSMHVKTVRALCCFARQASLPRLAVGAAIPCQTLGRAPRRATQHQQPLRSPVHCKCSAGARARRLQGLHRGVKRAARLCRTAHRACGRASRDIAPTAACTAPLAWAARHAAGMSQPEGTTPARCLTLPGHGGISPRRPWALASQLGWLRHRRLQSGAAAPPQYMCVPARALVPPCFQRNLL